MQKLVLSRSPYQILGSFMALDNLNREHLIDKGIAFADLDYSHDRTGGEDVVEFILGFTLLHTGRDTFLKSTRPMLK